MTHAAPLRISQKSQAYILYSPVVMTKYRLVTVTIIQTPYLDVFISWSSDYEITVLRLKIETLYLRRTCTHYVYRPSPLYGSVQGNQSPHPSYRESSVIPAEMALPLRRSRKVSVHFRITFGPLFQRQSWCPSFHIHYFHTKILQRHCFQFLLGITVVTTKIEDDT